MSNDYEQDSKVFYRFVPTESFDLLDISPKNVIFLKTFNSEILYTKVWFTDKNYKQLEIKNKININLVIN